MPASVSAIYGTAKTLGSLSLLVLPANPFLFSLAWRQGSPGTTHTCLVLHSCSTPHPIKSHTEIWLDWIDQCQDAPGEREQHFLCVGGVLGKGKAAGPCSVVSHFLGFTRFITLSGEAGTLEWGLQKLKQEPSPATLSLCGLWQVLQHPSEPGYEMEMIPVFQPCPN